MPVIQAMFSPPTPPPPLTVPNLPQIAPLSYRLEEAVGVPSIFLLLLQSPEYSTPLVCAAV